MKSYYIVCNFGCVQKTYEGFFYANQIAEKPCKHDREQFVLDIQQYRKFRNYMRENYLKMFDDNIIVEHNMVQLRIEKGQIKPFLMTDFLIVDIEARKARLLREEKKASDRTWIRLNGLNPDGLLQPFVERDKRIAEKVKDKLEELKSKYSLEELKKELGI